MIVWGGSTGGLFTEQNTGGQYNPSLNSWTATSTSGAPAARASHSAVWSGNEMIVWGGSAGGSLDTGARYNPSNNTWVNVTTTGAPTPRTGHTAIWTGNRVIVWGGASSFGNTNTGGRYDPTADSWQPTATTSPSPRQYHRAIWTGNEMIVWGGTPAIDYSQSVATGARYSPAVDSWMPTSMNNAPSPRSEHSSIWTGSEMIIWGGANSGPGLADGRRYNPLTDTWTTISGANAPSGRQSHTAVWTGTEMLIWGGMDITTVTRLNTGARYSPTSNSWASITTVNAPPGRDSHTAVWTGSEMIIWGGFGNSFPWELGDGRRYNPLSDAWTNVSTVGSPIPRHYHTAVWTGTDMIVWGGSTNDPPRLNTGGRYNPADNLWTATPTIGAPPGTMLHTAVWTGKQMIVWGGFGGTGDAVAATGGSYDPLANSWALTTLAQAPLPRELHTTVWTGSEMLVFGGFANVGAVNSVHSYTPSRIVYLYQKP